MRSIFALTESAGRLMTVFGATVSSTTGWKPSYRFGAARKIVIVRSRARGAAQPDAPVERELATASWGFTPPWLTDEVQPPTRVGFERLDSNGFFRDALVSRRCLVPMLGYFEWHDGNEGDEPYFARSASPVLAAAGIYSVRHIGSRSRLSVALVTRDAGIAGDDRVPSFLDEPAWDEWLDPTPLATTGPLLRMLGTRSAEMADLLTAHRVARTIDSPSARDSAALIAPLKGSAEKSRASG